ncbi:putative phospholipase D [Helianthus annuus]|nr:putative phospholipase D [Helianthus annuus]
MQSHPNYLPIKTVFGANTFFLFFNSFNLQSATMADNSSAKLVLLHGDLDLEIIEAKNLPNMDVVTGHILRCVSFDPCPDDTPVAGSSDLKLRSSGRKIIASDPYVKVSVPQAAVARTRVLKNNKNPQWNERFNIPLAHEFAHLEFEVKDDDIFGADLLGKVQIPAEEIAIGDEISGWFELKNSRKDASLRLKMKYTPCEQNSIYRNGIAGDPEQKGVQNAYFPLRKGSRVTLYQDAHVREMPEIRLDGGRVYEHGTCWEDICHAISSAHHMIYIVGWSVFHKVKLIREPTRTQPRGWEKTLGDLLKYKSEEGVRVLLLVWDDKTSHSTLFGNTTGVMQTHDEETKKFFKHSSVKCVLSPRYGSGKLGLFKQQVVGGAFTHHQKCVLVDTQADGNNRKITAFIGGLDLCDGRYDTPEHRLFHDLDTVFKDDVHQPTFPAGTKAPRQPWHDLHCKIEGPAAYDVLLNFEQRWRKATRFREFKFIAKRMAHREDDDSLLKIDRISWIASPTYPAPVNGAHTVVPADDPSLYVSSEDDPDNWHVQIFRSIDSGSLRGFPKTVDVAEQQNLITAKSMVIEKSIQTAYIQAIRSAQHFIYIENQYFIGSSYAWSYENAGADNLIPMELAQKIASKIRNNERFAVYVVIPMWPEGVPTSATVQEILYWQSQTMEMMYGVVTKAIKSMKLNAHPQDYLNFYCLGKREDMPFESNQSFADEKVSDSQKFKRFMIYVHAKGMIVDDEYVIVGSANINQRSMAGSKDTEIAMGSYQPHHTWAAKKRHPHGQVYGYRMSLWAEHLGVLEKCYEDPETVECVQKVNTIAEDNWTRYTKFNYTALQGHLLRYPLQVDDDGNVKSLSTYENFPDVGGKILGAHSPALPDILTT